jgi:hypothetical protein
MESDLRVCPYCGEPPGPGVFCAACGRNLSAIDRLPTRAEWEAQADSQDAAQRPPEDPASIAARLSAAVARFLESMQAGGNAGLTTMPTSERRAFRRQPTIPGWVVRPVARDDEERPWRYEPGLFLSADGAFHRIDSEVRGWGQRDYPQFSDSVSAQAIEPPADPRLIDELAALLRAHAAEARP